MAGGTKRSRQDDIDTPITPPPSQEVEDTPTPTPTPTATPTPPITRNSSSSIHTRRQATTGTNNDTTTTSSRPPLTRSSATQPPPPRNNGLGRSNSLFNMSTRRSGLTSISSSSSSSSSTSFAIPSGSGSSRVGMLTRTQSTPSITSPSQLKAIEGGSGGSGPAGKGDPEDGLGGGGPSKRFGKGKENIPPKKDNNENSSSGSGGQEGGSQRKRPRVSSRASMSGSARSRGRSGSVVSVRSETSGRHSSLAPSSSASSIASWSARLPSPAPSQASSITPSLDSVTSADPLDLIKDEDEFDVDKTPTKARPVTRSTVLPPTPPPSSPSLRDVEIKSTTERVNLMRMYSDKTETDEDVDMSEDKAIKLNPYKQLKAHLRLSSATSESTSTDQVIIGREEEKKVLRSYLTNRNDVDVGMYISGPPGTGKTALVTALGRELAEEGWKVVELGCMGLKVTDIWRRLGEELICGKTEKDVKDFIAQADSKVFIILDEVDSLMPPPPSIAPPATSHLLTKLFSLPLLSPTVKLISISNTLDLTLRARLVLPDSAQPLVLPFKAYNAGEMAPIVSSRIAAATATMSHDGQAIKIDPTAITLLTKKVEAQNGDLRMCLGVLCSAITLAENEWLKKKSNQALADGGEKKEIPMTKIAVTHILKALTSYTQQLKSAAGSTSSSTGSATSKKIRSVQIQGKMVLVSLLVYLTRVKYGLNGCPSISTSNGQITPPLTPSKSSSNLNGELTVQNLYTTYCHLLSHDHSPFPPSPESDYRDLLSNLETLGLVSIVGGGSGLGSIGLSRSSSGGSGSSTRSKCSSSSGGGGKIELCVKEEELKDGLGLGSVSGSTKVQNKGIAEEEVNKIWEREEGRLKRMKEKERARLAGLADGTSEQYI
ncbi:hypothetical protein I203_107139 [Kwoniella mangroviensis CBS 8507]|uniref:hypothetical protein n=1 Tax=Kwoniella mangroviensis CBS 8507 TaxID=1296122 RepID=UPI00080CF194|nr:uncharacterized protein I203_01887 [Kwoniella mangroviensis CBS 8507]OCF68504.1 hypothetical protein I203_01887 [Kwoniella mangroviensis CBS 8507]